MRWRNLTMYMTIWNVLLLSLGRWTHPHIDLVLTSALVMTMASFLVYVLPGYTRWADFAGNPEKTGKHVTMTVTPQPALDIALHVALHVVPLIIALYVYGSYYMRRALGAHTLVAVLALSLYACIIPRFEEVYDIPAQYLLMVGSAAACAYVLMHAVLRRSFQVP